MEYSLTGKMDLTRWVVKDVLNPRGIHLGTISDFVTDSDGRVSFAILSHGGWLGIGQKRTAVPYSALSFDRSAEYAVLDICRDRFVSTPDIGNKKNLTDRHFAVGIYRYFGQVPYRTEEGMREAPRSTKEMPMKGY